MSTDTYEPIRKRARAVVLAHHATLSDLATHIDESNPLPYQRISEYLRGVYVPKFDVVMKMKDWGDMHWSAAKGKRKSELNRAMQAQGD